MEKLPLDADASPAMVGFSLHQHELARARIMMTYSRKQTVTLLAVFYKRSRIALASRS